MNVAGPQPAEPKSRPRWYHPTPAWLVLGLLAVEGLLWLSERFHWFAFNERKGWTVLIGVAGVAAVFAVMLLWLVAALVFRLRFQFSIRSLLVLTVAVAVPCSWLAVEMKKAKEQGVLVNEVKSEGVKVQYDWEFDAGGNPLPTAQPSGPAWLRGLLRDDFFSHVADMSFGTDASDKSLEHLDSLTRLRSLDLSWSKVTDKGLEHLRGLTQLQHLDLRETAVTDTGLEHLKGLTQLRELALGDRVTDTGLEHLRGLTRLRMLMLGDGVTDTGLEHLEGLTELRILCLIDTQVTDTGLAHLKGLTQLGELLLGDTKVTDQGVEKLQQALPNCKIER